MRKIDGPINYIHWNKPLLGYKKNGFLKSPRLRVDYSP